MAEDLSTDALIEQIRNGDFSTANDVALSLLDKAGSVTLNPSQI
jgi:hypothetical protein